MVNIIVKEGIDMMYEKPILELIIEEAEDIVCASVWGGLTDGGHGDN